MRLLTLFHAQQTAHRYRPWFRFYERLKKYKFWKKKFCANSHISKTVSQKKKRTEMYVRLEGVYLPTEFGDPRTNLIFARFRRFFQIERRKLK